MSRGLSASRMAGTCATSAVSATLGSARRPCATSRASCRRPRSSANARCPRSTAFARPTACRTIRGLSSIRCPAASTSPCPSSTHQRWTSSWWGRRARRRRCRRPPSWPLALTSSPRPYWSRGPSTGARASVRRPWRALPRVRGGRESPACLHAAGLLDEVFVTLTDVVIDETAHEGVPKIFDFESEGAVPDRGGQDRSVERLDLPPLASTPLTRVASEAPRSAGRPSTDLRPCEKLPRHPPLGGTDEVIHVARRHRRRGARPGLRCRRLGGGRARRHLGYGVHITLASRWLDPARPRESPRRSWCSTPSTTRW